MLSQDRRTKYEGRNIRYKGDGGARRSGNTDDRIFKGLSSKMQMVP